MKKWMKPAMEVVEVDMTDVIATSGGVVDTPFTVNVTEGAFVDESNSSKNGSPVWGSGSSN